MRVLDLGYGRAKTAGAIGIDVNRDSDADVIHDLEYLPYLFLDDTFDRIMYDSVIKYADFELVAVK